MRDQSVHVFVQCIDTSTGVAFQVLDWGCAYIANRIGHWRSGWLSRTLMNRSFCHLFHCIYIYLYKRKLRTKRQINYALFKKSKQKLNRSIWSSELSWHICCDKLASTSDFNRNKTSRINLDEDIYAFYIQFQKAK